MCSCYTLPPFSRHRPLSEPIDCAQHPSSPFPLTLSLAPAMLCVQILDLDVSSFVSPLDGALRGFFCGSNDNQSTIRCDVTFSSTSAALFNSFRAHHRSGLPLIMSLVSCAKNHPSRLQNERIVRKLFFYPIKFLSCDVILALLFCPLWSRCLLDPKPPVR